MKLTKATIKRLNKHTRWIKDESGTPVHGDGYSVTMCAVADVIQNACIILSDEKGRYFENDETDELLQPVFKYDDILDRYSVTGTVYGDFVKRILSGVCTRFPKVLSTTFTHGNNGIEIYDVNKLVKIIADEKIA